MVFVFSGVRNLCLKALQRWTTSRRRGTQPPSRNPPIGAIISSYWSNRHFANRSNGYLMIPLSRASIASVVVLQFIQVCHLMVHYFTNWGSSWHWYDAYLPKNKISLWLLYFTLFTSPIFLNASICLVNQYELKTWMTILAWFSFQGWHEAVMVSMVLLFC